MKYKLYIRQYDITTNDYKVREEIVETNDIYHEIGKIYSTAFTEIKRIDYEKIDETKELKQEIERLNKALLDIKEYVKELETEEYGNQLYSIGSGEQIYILNIINKALGSEKE